METSATALASVQAFKGVDSAPIILFSARPQANLAMAQQRSILITGASTGIGLATARALREHIPQSACPIVIMATAFSFTTLASQPDAELVDALLYKPVTASGLYNAVMEAQHRRAATVGVLPTLMQMSRDGLAGVRVLVVDDSDINRDVAQRILMGQGATVSLAVDGEDAILWLLSHPDEVDLVLMDVQMPVLDGIEATRRLRRMPQFDDLPIVALTAGAFKSQQDAAIEAGMTHFVSKPFDVPSTIALIQRLRRRANATPVMPSADIVASLVSPPHHEAWPEVNVLHVGQGLQLWSDVMTYHSYLRRFVDGYRHAAADIAANLAKGDRAAAAALAHKLSGVAANLALQDTRRLAGELEKALMGDDDPALILAQLVQALSAAVTAIDQYATSNPRGTDAQPTPGSAPSAPPLSSEQQAVLKVLLVNLLAALDTDNSTPAKKILMSINPLLPPWVLADIWANVVDYDFRGAEASTLQLASGYSIHIGD